MAKRPRTPRGALNAAALDELALAYVGRYATSTGRLGAYLARKVRERGWEGDGAAADAIERSVAAMVERRYVDDRHFALTRGAALQRRGLGARRIGEQLRYDGLGAGDRAAALEEAAQGLAAVEAALTLARRRRLGPFARAAPAGDADPRAIRDRAIAAFLRAGHDLGLARRIMDCAPGSDPRAEDLAD